jgi:hypothetical protein
MASDGTMQEVTPDVQRTALARFLVSYAAATKLRQHLWVATMAYLVDPTQDQTRLDTASMIGPPGVGCYICEMTYRPELLNGHCKGEPRGE